MKSKHPWVDPEQIRKLAERLMAPYAGLEPVQSEPEQPEQPEQVPVPDLDRPVLEQTTVRAIDGVVANACQGLYGTLSGCIDATAAASWRRPRVAPSGQDHPLRLLLGQWSPQSTGLLEGPGGERCFDDGDFAALEFLVGQLRAGGATGVWLKWRLSAGEVLDAGVVTTSRGLAVCLLRSPGGGIAAEILAKLVTACEREFSAI